MITVKRLKEILARLPDDAEIFAYEGEDTGLTVSFSTGEYGFIRARETNVEDDQAEGLMPTTKEK